jgi:hypothetical protein
MSKDRHGFRLSMFLLQFFPILNGIRVSPEEKHGGLREGPFQVCVSDLLAGAAETLSC